VRRYLFCGTNLWHHKIRAIKIIIIQNGKSIRGYNFIHSCPGSQHLMVKYATSAGENIDAFAKNGLFVGRELVIQLCESNQ
jgi:hypothetical protein